MGEIAPLQRGFDLPTQNIKKGNIPIVYSNGILNYHNESKCKAPGLVTGRSGTIGKFTFIKSEEYWPHNTTLWATTFYDNYPCFIYYLYQSINIEQFATGSGVPTLNRNDVHKKSSCIPSIAEQKKIAQFLTLIDESISTQSKIIEKYESLIKGIKNCVLYHPRAQKIALKNILIDRNERSVTNNQYKILSSTTKGLFLQSEYFDREIASENNIGYKVVNINDIIISPQNLWMGNITFNERFENGLVSPSYKVYAIDESFNKYFVAAILKTHRALHAYLCVSEQGASIVRRNLNIELFNELTFSIPSIEMQDKIGGFLKSLDSKLKLEKNFLKLLKQQKIYLLKQMFI